MKKHYGCVIGTIADSARNKRDKPYKVRNIETKDFYNWKNFADNF